jgi:hypothetical protein
MSGFFSTGNPLDHKDNLYHKDLGDHDLSELAELCANVARNLCTDHMQSNTAFILRQEWIRLDLDHLLEGGKTDAEKFLKRRMLEFLAGVPTWMLAGF